MGIEAKRRPSRIARAVRTLAGASALVGGVLTAVSLANGALPFRGVPAWTWLALALASLLIREAVWVRQAGVGFRKGRRPR